MNYETDTQPTKVEPGKKYRVLMPYSEVCMFMQIADKPMLIEMINEKYPVIQLYKEDGSIYSFPITTGEAGVYYNSEDGYYTYLLK